MIYGIRCLARVIFVAGILLAVQPAWAQERILDFHSDVEVRRDSVVVAGDGDGIAGIWVWLGKRR